MLEKKYNTYGRHNYDIHGGKDIITAGDDSNAFTKTIAFYLECRNVWKSVENRRVIDVRFTKYFFFKAVK